MALVPTSKVCGAVVNDAAGEKLGTVTELMLDDAGGGIGYAVLSFGGTLGVGEKLFAVPFARLAPAGGGFTLAVDRAELEAAPGFDKDAWPTDADPLFS